MTATVSPVPPAHCSVVSLLSAATQAVALSGLAWRKAFSCCESQRLLFCVPPWRPGVDPTWVVMAATPGAGAVVGGAVVLVAPVVVLGAVAIWSGSTSVVFTSSVKGSGPTEFAGSRKTSPWAWTNSSLSSSPASRR